MKISQRYPQIMDFYEKRQNNEHFLASGIFLGGICGAFFAIWSISSHVGVQIGLELVRLIALIYYLS